MSDDIEIVREALGLMKKDLDQFYDAAVRKR